MGPPAKRRIQPQLIPPSQGQPFSAASQQAFTSGGVNGLTQIPTQAVKGQPQLQPLPEPKEDSEMAVRLGMKGRRIYVPLSGNGNQEVDFKKLLKQQGVTHTQQAIAPHSEPLLPGRPKVQKQGRSAMPLAGVIARLERQYVQGDDDDSSSNERSHGPSLDQPEHSGEESGAEKGERENIGEYNMEDDFIDDEEFANFVEGDRRRSKIEGFFVNKGAIEKVDEKEARTEAERPKKKAKKSVPEEIKRAKAPEAANDRAKTQAEPKRQKQRKLDSPSKAAQEVKVASAEVMPAAGLPAAANPSDISSLAALAGRIASQSRPPLASVPQQRAPVEPHNGPTLDASQQQDTASAPVSTSQAQVQPATQPAATQGLQGCELSAEMSSALASLQGLVDVAKSEAAKQPAASKTIPKTINPGLTQFACVLAAECAARPAARDPVLDQVVQLFEPLYSRGKFVKRLESLAKIATDELAAARGKIKDISHAKLEALKSVQAQQVGGAAESAPKPEEFAWDKNIEHYLLNYRNSYKKVHGSGKSDEDIMRTLLELWPPGSMSLDGIMSALGRAFDNPKAARGPRKSLEGGDQFSKATAVVPPTAAEPAGSAAAAGGRQQETAHIQPPEIRRLHEVPTAAQPQATAAQPPATASEPSAPAIQSQAIAVQPPLSGEESSQTQRQAVAQPQAVQNSTAQGQGQGLATAVAPPQPPGTAGLPAGQPVALEALLRLAHELGADDKLLVESIGEAKNIRFSILTMVLMCAGPKGYTAQEMVDKANALGLSLQDGGPWDAKMRRAAAMTTRASKYMVNIGASHYAHIAFPGVQEKAAKEMEAKKKSKTESLASKVAIGLPRGSSAELDAQV